MSIEKKSNSTTDLSSDITIGGENVQFKLQNLPEAVKKQSQLPSFKRLTGRLFSILFIFFLFNLGIEFVRFFFTSFGCGTNKGYNAEAKQYVSSMNKAQQAYFTETSAFANSIEEMAVGIRAQTSYFQYSTRVTKKAAFNYGIPYRDVYKTFQFGIINWQYKDRELNSYVGAVFVINDSTETITCKSAKPAKTRPADPIIQNGVPTCGSGTEKLR